MPTTAYDFANGEIYVRFGRACAAATRSSCRATPRPINQWIMEQLLMVDALKRASAKRITVVVPFYGYSRQDKKHRGREPISARLMADLFKTAGADRMMSVDLHTAQIQGFFDGPVDHLWALPLLADYVRSRSTRASSPSSPRTPAGCAWPTSGRTGSARRSRSSTSAATPTSPTRSRCTSSSATCRGGPACSSTT